MPVRGARQAAGGLRQLAAYVATPLNAASRFALQPALSASRKNAKSAGFEDSTGALAASLTIKRNSRSAKLNPMHRVGPSKDYEKGDRKPVKYAHLLEFGTSRIAPKPFLTPAYLETKEQVVKRFGDRIGPEMEKRAAKVRKR